MAEYSGPERRKDFVQLDEALAEVDKLHSAVTTLATAVVNTVPRQELVALHEQADKEKKSRNIIEAGLSLGIVLLLIIFMNYKSNKTASETKHHHQVVACLLAQPEASRTGTLAATALVTCEQTVK